jgi:hypothetical protein
MSITEYDIHDELIQKECIRLHTHIRYRILQEKDFFELNKAVLKITEYIVKLERENLGLKEYKKHQERANERRYHTGYESWHRGSVIVNENKKKRK